MSFLDEPGELAEVPLAAVLIEALNQRATGVLSVEHGGGTSRVFVRGGVPVGAQSFGGFRPLGKVLLTEGLIDVEVFGTSLAEMARSGKRHGEVLVEMGAVTREQVDRALSEQQATYLTQVAALASGRFRFDRSEPIPPWTGGVRISPLKAIVQALEAPPARPLVISALQPAAAGPAALASGYGQLAAAFGWSAAESALVDRLQVLTTLDAFFAAPGVPPERARAILAALLLLGLASTRSGRETLESVPGLVVDLADLAGVPIEPENDRGSHSTSTPAETGTPSPIPTRSTPPRRSDPEVARRRRQRLLQRAMQNMGVGPFSGQPPPPRGSRPHAPEPRPPPTPAERELRRALVAAEPRARSSDLFERLGLARTATREQVKAAYFQIAKQLHPDRFALPALSDVGPQVKDLFSAMNEAYEILSDDRKRAEYLARTAPSAGAAAATTEAGPETAAVAYQKAEACARTRDFGKARGFYEAALRADPRPEYQAAYASMLLSEGRSADRGRAKALAEAALRDPACDRAAFLCGVLAREDGDDDKAEHLFRRALAANPRQGEAERELHAVEARRAKRKPSGLFRKR